MSKLLLRISALFMCILIYVQGICPFFSYPSPKHKIDYDELISSFYNPKGRIMSMAHRGDWKNYPENSLPSIQACIDMGVDIVEIDIQRTSDGVLVLSHDEKIDRMTNGSGKIEEMTYSEINKFYLKGESNEKI